MTVEAVQESPIDEELELAILTRLEGADGGSPALRTTTSLRSLSVPSAFYSFTPTL